MKTHFTNVRKNHLNVMMITSRRAEFFPENFDHVLINFLQRDFIADPPQYLFLVALRLTLHPNAG
jgi:hypothetical protein